MSLIQLIALLCATLLIAYLVIHTLRIARTTKAYRLLASDLEGCGVLGFSGCSILCRRPSDIGQIEALLGSGYDRYEVVAVWDSRLDGEILNSTIRHFKMIRVNTPSIEGLPSSRIRALYRSRCRCFRRLVVVDAERGRRHDDFNAAAAVASYDYLLPLATGCRLRRGAIEAIAVTLTNLADKQIDLLRSTVDGCCIIRREALISNGGFSPMLNPKATLSERYSLPLALLDIPAARVRKGAIYGLVVTTALVGLGLFSSHPALRLAFIAAAIACITTARYLVLIVVENESIGHTLYNIGQPLEFFFETELFCLTFF